MDWALDLFFFHRMTLLFQGLGYLCSYKPPYSQQVSPESFPAIASKLERQLQLQVEAYRTISSRLWVAVLVKILAICAYTTTFSVAGRLA